MITCGAGVIDGPGDEPKPCRNVAVADLVLSDGDRIKVCEPCAAMLRTKDLAARGLSLVPLPKSE